MHTLKTGLALAVLATTLLASTPGQARTSRPPDMTRHRDMIYVTLVRVSTERAIPFSAYYSTTPDKGNLYLTVWLRAVNRNDAQLALDPNDFTVVTPDGRSHNQDYRTPSPELGRAILDVRGHAGGSMTFQVPLGMHQATLQWTPSPASYGLHWPSASWSLSY